MRIGIDFGTTNSSLAWANPDGGVEIARFHGLGAATRTFRSILFFEASRYGRKKPVPKTGPQAIEAYLERADKGRLIQSIKSLASDRQFGRTQIAGHYFTFEELVGFIVRDMLQAVSTRPGETATKVVVGRPVKFVGAASEEDDSFAEERLRGAFALAGLPEVIFEYEPLGAAYHYEHGLRRDELVLIADFGGGTSDFSIVRVGPDAPPRGSVQRILATEGLPLAGDAFDAAMVRHLVSPLLGRGSYYRSMEKRLPMPSWLYRNLERWHHLSFLQSKRNLEMIRSLKAQAEQPEEVERLLRLVEDDLGFQLHRAIQKTKEDLSHASDASFRFSEPGLDIELKVSRESFERWIAGGLTEIEGAVQRVVASAGIESKQVDRVFLTGGTSLVPSVKGIFERQFGPERISTGDEFTSVVAGLALRAKEED